MSGLGGQPLPKQRVPEGYKPNSYSSGFSGDRASYRLALASLIYGSASLALILYLHAGLHYFNDFSAIVFALVFLPSGAVTLYLGSLALFRLRKHYAINGTKPMAIVGLSFGAITALSFGLLVLIPGVVLAAVCGLIFLIVKLFDVRLDKSANKLDAGISEITEDELTPLGQASISSEDTLPHQYHEKRQRHGTNWSVWLSVGSIAGFGAFGAGILLIVLGIRNLQESTFLIGTACVFVSFLTGVVVSRWKYKAIKKMLNRHNHNLSNSSEQANPLGIKMAKKLKFDFQMARFKHAAISTLLMLLIFPGVIFIWAGLFFIDQSLGN